MENVKGLTVYYLQLIWRRRWLALGTAWLVCCLGWVGVAALPDRYSSEARFYVDTMSLLNPLLKGISVNADDNSRDQEVLVMQRTLTSRPNLQRVAQMTDLDKSTNSDEGLEKLIDQLESRIALRAQGTNLFQLEYIDNSPRVARDVVQALLTIFVENSVGNKREDIQTARSFIEEQIDDYEKQLTEAEARLADFKVKYIDFFSSKSENFAARLQIAKEDVERAENDLQDAMVMRDNTRKQLEGTPQFLDINSAPQVVVGGAPQSLQQRIAAMQARLDDLRLMYTEKHPDVLRVQAAMQELINEQTAVPEPGAPDTAAAPRSQVPNPLHAQMGMKLADAESLVASLQRRVENTKKVMLDLERKAAEAPRVEAEFTSLNRDYQVMKSNYENLLMRRESARIAQAADSSTEPVQFRIIAAPEVPLNPSGPQRRLFNTIVLVFGLVAGAGFIVLLSQIDGNISRPEDLADFADYSFLGSVSPAVMIETAKKSLLAMHGRFGVATAGLIVLFGLFMYWTPNLSNLPDQLSTVLL
ncbi:MAG: hypothetical protein SFV21_04955 [Rhodospirillaceae bacterium]|nr:hypothetical protein [Rhodospirillaceae bacterium]